MKNMSKFFCRSLTFAFVMALNLLLVEHYTIAKDAVSSRIASPDRVNDINELYLKKQTSTVTLMDAQTFFERGRQLASEDRYTEALANLTQAVELDPNYLEAYFYRANVLGLMNQPERAIEDAEKTVRLYETRGEIDKAQVMRQFTDSLREGMRTGEFEGDD